MFKPKISTGYELVDKGYTKIQTILPEAGLKDVQPNGSWLESKQIQSALQARKHLIEVERVEKSGTVSIAIWREELMLAEVIQMVGGHWKFMGHNKGNKLYLHPEEALFLMEVNCLHLKNNDVKVSLQQAYILLLRGSISLLQYKVYASLSRLGYRIFRHKKGITEEFETQTNDTSNLDTNSSYELPEEHIKTEDVEMESVSNGGDDLAYTNTEEQSHTIDSLASTTMSCNKKMLEKLQSRRLRTNSQTLGHFFDALPSFLEKRNITIIINKLFIPNTINLIKEIYDVNLDTVSNRSVNTVQTSVETNIFSADEDANDSHVRRLQNYSANTRPGYRWNSPPHFRLNFQNIQFQQFSYSRPRPNFYYNFNMMYQRPFFQRSYVAPFYRFFYNQPYMTRPSMNTYRSGAMNYYNTNYSIRYKRKRQRNRGKKYQLDHLKRIARRLKESRSFVSENVCRKHVQSLKKQINSFNAKFNENMKLDNNFDIVEENFADDYINLDDAEAPAKKKTKIVNDELFESNLAKLKLLAIQLKDLENNKKATPRHKRALSKALKTLNNSYNVEYNINNFYDIIDSRYISLDSSSDNSVTEEEVPRPHKKLKNPFNILKRLSEKQNIAQSNSTPVDVVTKVKESKYKKWMLDTIPKCWLPDENEFGSADVATLDDLIDIGQEEFLYDFLKMQPDRYESWLDLKLSFYSSLDEAVAEFRSARTRVKPVSNSLVKPEDCKDMESVLNKLRIIKTEAKINDDLKLSIDFDVYNRDVSNFRKSNPPKPHFRIICLKETSPMPSGDEVATLKAKNDDNISVVFAVVGDASISYLQIKPADMPVFIANN